MCCDLSIVYNRLSMHGGKGLGLGEYSRAYLQGVRNTLQELDNGKKLEYQE